MLLAFASCPKPGRRRRRAKERRMPPKSQRWWLTTDSRSTVIEAPADRVYDLVADLTRMGEWSNECARVEWTDGAAGPAEGARFVGHNQTGPRGMIKWSRHGRVLTA